ncbi:MAG TPA: DUF1990 domain-containing protein [Vicinamibacterales bacterium]|nr:DUF1990 domain-containing protein [Vicinamibacterales bacterium]
MFLLRRPSRREIERFLDRSRRLPLSYGPTGTVRHGSAADRVGEHVVTIGHGKPDFERARLALAAWKHFDLGWVEAYPAQLSVEAGTDVAVLIRHLGFWSLNGARVLYQVGGFEGQDAFGFAYGTLTNHAESGEELFEVSIDRQSGDVMYRIRVVSRPQSSLTWIGLPIVRRLQARFRHDSAVAMRRSSSAPTTLLSPSRRASARQGPPEP